MGAIKMIIDKLSLLTDPSFQLWNDENLAFIKKDIYEGKYAWIIYDSSGEKIAATETKEFAYMVARQNDLQPCCVS